MKREVKGLKWAERLRAKPLGIPVGRPRGVKAFGLRYERAIEKELGEAQRGVWFAFEDRNGPGWCQMDFLLAWGGRSLILEAKNTWVEEGHWELERLYLPIAEGAGLPRPLGVVICKNLVLGMRGVRVSDNIAEAMKGAESARSVLHWIGKGPLLRRPVFYGRISPCALAEGQVA